MKKTIILALAVVLSTTMACKKKEVVLEPSNNATVGSATIKGRIKGEINSTSGNLVLEKIAGIKVFVTYNEEDLYLNPASGSFPNIVKETVTDANGDYTITVECGAKNLDVTIKTQDTRFDVLTGGPTLALPNEPIVTTSTLFPEISQVKTVYKSGAFIVDFTL